MERVTVRTRATELSCCHQCSLILSSTVRSQPSAHLPIYTSSSERLILSLCRGQDYTPKFSIIVHAKLPWGQPEDLIWTRIRATWLRNQQILVLSTAVLVSSTKTEERHDYLNNSDHVSCSLPLPPPKEWKQTNDLPRLFINLHSLPCQCLGSQRLYRVMVHACFSIFRMGRMVPSWYLSLY